jgi:hypothetical protein
MSDDLQYIGVYVYRIATSFLSNPRRESFTGRCKGTVDDKRTWKKLLFALPIFSTITYLVFIPEGKMLPSRLQIALGLPNIFLVYSWALWFFFFQIQRPRSMPMLSYGVLLTIEKDQKTILHCKGMSCGVPSRTTFMIYLRGLLAIFGEPAWK